MGKKRKNLLSVYTTHVSNLRSILEELKRKGKTEPVVVQLKIKKALRHAKMLEKIMETLRHDIEIMVELDDEGKVRCDICGHKTNVCLISFIDMCSDCRTKLRKTVEEQKRLKR